MSFRDIGTMGESFFQTWCAASGLTANKSLIDRTGWDFIVEFPHEPAPGFADSNGPPIECRVQVKATDNKARKCQITLSNLHRLATSLSPVFFLFLEFDGKQDPQRAFLVHLGEDLIRSILKRVREIDQSEKENQFNKRKMTIKYNEKDKIAPLTGWAVRENIEKHVLIDLTTYSENKQRILQSAGYEESYGKIKFNTLNEENLEHLIDVSLGLRESVDVNNTTFHSSRFGVLSSVAIKKGETANLKMPNLKPSATGILRFRESKYTAGLTFDCQIFSSPFNQGAPKNLVKYRIEGTFFDIILKPHANTINYSFSLEACEISLLDLIEALKLMSMLERNSNGITMSIEVEGYPSTEYSLGSNENKNLVGTPDLFEKLNNISCFFNFDRKAIVSYNEILKRESLIYNIDKIISSPDSVWRVEFSVDDDSFTTENGVCCQFAIVLPLGKYFVGCIVSLVGTATMNSEKKYKLYSDTAFFDQKSCISREGNLPETVVKELFESAEKQYEDQGLSVVRILDLI